MILKWRRKLTPKLSWRVPDKSVLLEAAAMAVDLVAGFKSVPGQQGTTGGATRIDASLSASWIIPHTLGRVPIVQVFEDTGEQLIADVLATDTQISVTHGQPVAGFVLIT